MNNSTPQFSLNYLVLCYLATVVGDNEISNDKNEDELLAISIAMAMQRYDAGQIA